MLESPVRVRRPRGRGRDHWSSPAAVARSAAGGWTARWTVDAPLQEGLDHRLGAGMGIGGEDGQEATGCPDRFLGAQQEVVGDDGVTEAVVGWSVWVMEKPNGAVGKDRVDLQGAAECRDIAGERGQAEPFGLAPTVLHCPR